jgi:hypothetical protein
MAALGSLVALTAASLVALTGARQPSAAALAAATVNVDAATNLGALNNPSFYQNHTGTPLGPGDLERLKEIGPVVARQWAKPKFYYDRATGTYTFPTARFDETARNADSMLFNFGQCDPALMTLSAPETCRAVLKAGIKYYKERYPELRYIELFNEPDKTWTPSPDEEPAIPVDQYYQWYKIGYSIVNEVNGELAPAVPLRICSRRRRPWRRSATTSWTAAWTCPCTGPMTTRATTASPCSSTRPMARCTRTTTW